MGSQELSRLRREIWQEFSDAQVELLNSLRDDISSRRWKIMLDIDAVRGYVTGMETSVQDPELKKILVEVSTRLTEVHKELSRIPEEIIPPF
ncbi:MAG: hypothetical protein IIA51_08195 [Chloroflexi bacterium]|nr:hypothetical protein [Chloroflexota bacterium]MCH8876543.1 hypothetical protein [Chloroflexota bacterium]